MTFGKIVGFGGKWTRWWI